MVEPRWLTDNAHPRLGILGLLVSNVYLTANRFCDYRDGAEGGAQARCAMPDPERLENDLNERAFRSATSS